ncbi:MAG: tRNA adenosine(34) deaminase TadA [Candidatus Omnitrophica bacterium]|nr:tRNA adenosine(34) deaminase TadA [Candidatus Omnitrophota bacterium]
MDQHYMREALKQAKRAGESGEVPIGAVIVHKNQVIARAYNQVELLHDPTAHAEMIAITQAADHLKNERLLDTWIYTTLEPCAMCAGAMVLARISRLIYAAADPKAGACGSAINVVRTGKLNHQLEITRGVLEEESRPLIQAFFKEKRK